MTELTTASGRALEEWLREPEDYEWGRKVTSAILAIEAEAREAAMVDAFDDVLRIDRAEARRLREPER